MEHYKTLFLMISLAVLGLFLAGCGAYDEIVLDSPDKVVNLPVYASMWNRSSAGVEVVLGGVGNYTNITHLREGEINGFNYTDSVLTVLYPGSYKIDWFMSFSGGNNNQYGMLVARNYNQNISRPCYVQRDTGAGSKGVVSASCILMLNASDTLSFLIEDEANPLANPTIYSIGVSVLRVD